ncbi:MAG: class II aldolase/adducin family protein [Acidimicrobiia bacterium]|nr:class II aldolase/adducin family protein [Acidimicrobiia bacterium]
MTASRLTASETKDLLLSTARDLLSKGLVEGTSGNLSARLPDGHVVMTPSSLDYEEMTLGDLVVCDLDGEVVEGERSPTTEKALHLACLRRWDDIHAVIHSHALYCSMFAVARIPIPCLIEELDVYVGGEVPVAEYKMTGSDELAAEVSRHVGDRAAVLMANHGLLAVGKDPRDAMKVTALVERTARIVWGARLLGDAVPLPPETVERFAGVYPLMRSL